MRLCRVFTTRFSHYAIPAAFCIGRMSSGREANRSSSSLRIAAAGVVFVHLERVFGETVEFAFSQNHVEGQFARTAHRLSATPGHSAKVAGKPEVDSGSSMRRPACATASSAPVGLYVGLMAPHFPLLAPAVLRLYPQSLPLFGPDPRAPDNQEHRGHAPLPAAVLPRCRPLRHRRGHRPNAPS